MGVDFLVSSGFSLFCLAGFPFSGGEWGVLFWVFLGGRGSQFLDRVFFLVWHISLGLLGFLHVCKSGLLFLSVLFGGRGGAYWMFVGTFTRPPIYSRYGF